MVPFMLFDDLKLAFDFFDIDNRMFESLVLTLFVLHSEVIDLLSNFR